MAVYGGSLLNRRITDVHNGFVAGGSGLAENLTTKEGSYFYEEMLQMPGGPQCTNSVNSII